MRDLGNAPAPCRAEPNCPAPPERTLHARTNHRTKARRNDSEPLGSRLLQRSTPSCSR